MKINKNKSQFFSTREEISEWLDKYGIKNYTINNNLSVDVNGGADISYNNFKIIPVKFGNVTGDFWCEGNKLISLTGSPETVGGGFWCFGNQLTNLMGSPKTVGGHFDCSYNKLTNLTGSPETVESNFWREKNKISSLEDIAINIGGYFRCNGNSFITLTDFLKINIGKKIILTLDKKNI